MNDTNKKIFWRFYGNPVWHEGWIVEQQGEKVKIGSHIGDRWGNWYQRNEIQIDPRE